MKDEEVAGSGGGRGGVERKADKGGVRNGREEGGGGDKESEHKIREKTKRAKALRGQTQQQRNAAETETLPST